MYKKNIVFFLIFVLFTPLTNFTFQPVDAQLQTIEHGKDYDRILIAKNDTSTTYKWIPVPERILDGDEYKDYIIREDGNNIYFESAMASYILDKNTCAFNMYDGGKIITPPKMTLSHTLKESVNATDFWYEASDNNLDCNYTISESNKMVQIVTWKGDFKIIYDIDYTQGFEWTYKYTNNKTEKTNHKYGFTFVCDGATCSDIKLNDNPIPEVLPISELGNSTLDIGVYELDPKNYVHNYMWALKKEASKSIMDFTAAKNILPVGHTLEVDPKITYDTSGIYDFVVPAGVGSITVKAWGAGGGGKDTAGGFPASSGGGGGFAKGTITVSAGQTYKVVVGGGGGAGHSTGTGAGGQNGGGGGGNGPTYGGGGGGYSGVFLSSVTHANARIIAGGGGGGGASYPSPSHGGAGGGTTGANGGCASSGGTQSSGGSSCGSPAGTSGSALQGGNGATTSNGGGGGGGGGYYGGGGGGGYGSYSYSGGGGSGFVHTSATDTQLTTGSGSSVANSGDSDYVSGRGNGSITSGQQGLVVISYTIMSIPNPPSNLLGVPYQNGVLYTWTQNNNTDIDRYYLGRSLDNSTWPATNKTQIMGQVTSFFDSSYYRKGLLYYVNVTSGNAVYNSTISAFTSFVNNLPDPITDLRVLSTTDTSVTLGYTMPNLYGGTFLGVQLNYTTPHNDDPNTVYYNSTTSNPITVSGLQLNKPYSFRAKVMTTGGSSMSNVIHVLLVTQYTNGWFKVTNPIMLDTDKNGIIDTVYNYSGTNALTFTNIFGTGKPTITTPNIFVGGSGLTHIISPYKGSIIGVGGSGYGMCDSDGGYSVTVNMYIVDTNTGVSTLMNTLSAGGGVTSPAAKYVYLFPYLLYNKTHYLYTGWKDSGCIFSALHYTFMNSTIVNTGDEFKVRVSDLMIVGSKIWYEGNNFTSTFINTITTPTDGFLFKAQDSTIKQQASQTHFKNYPPNVFAISKDTYLPRSYFFNPSVSQDLKWKDVISLSDLSNDVSFYLYYKTLKSDLSADVDRVKIEQGGEVLIGLVSSNVLYIAKPVSIGSKSVQLLDTYTPTVHTSSVTSALPSIPIKISENTLGDININKAGLIGLGDGFRLSPQGTVDRAFIPEAIYSGKIFPSIIPPTTGLTPLVITIKNAPNISYIRIVDNTYKFNNEPYIWTVKQLTADKTFTVDMPTNYCFDVHLSTDVVPRVWKNLGTLCASGLLSKTLTYSENLSFTFWTLPWGTSTEFDQKTGILETQVRNKNDGYTYNIRIYDRNGTLQISQQYSNATGLSVKTFNLTNLQKPARVEILDVDNKTLHFVTVGTPNYLQSIQMFANQYLTIKGFNLLALMPLIFGAMWTRNTVSMGTMMTVVMIMAIVWLGLISVPDLILYLMVLVAGFAMVAYRLLF